MALITQAVLANAAIAVDGMAQTQRVQLADDVFAHQPNLLASVLVLQRMGASLRQMEVPVHILLVAWQTMKTSGHIWLSLQRSSRPKIPRTQKFRFSAKRLAAHRKRLKPSAEGLGNSSACPDDESSMLMYARSQDKIAAPAAGARPRPRVSLPAAAQRSRATEK